MKIYEFNTHFILILIMGNNGFKIFHINKDNKFKIEEYNF